MALGKVPSLCVLAHRKEDLLKRGRDFQEWSGGTDPRRGVLISVETPSLHKGCFSVQSFTGGVYLPKKEGYLTHMEIFGVGKDRICCILKTPPHWKLSDPVTRG